MSAMASNTTMGTRTKTFFLCKNLLHSINCCIFAANKLHSAI